MKFPHVLFALLLAMCGVVIAAMIIGETPSVDIVSEETGETSRNYLGHGFTHPEYATMQSGGPGAARHDRVLWLGWAFGILQIVFFVGLLGFGGQKNGRVGPLAAPLIVFGLIFAAVFTGMVYTYQTYMLEDEHAMFLSLPIPTAWMVYGVWTTPVIFMFLYMFTFDSWTFRTEDMARFEAILAENQDGVGDQA